MIILVLEYRGRILPFFNELRLLYDKLRRMLALFNNLRLYNLQFFLE